MSKAALADHDLQFSTARLQARMLEASDEALFCTLYTDIGTMRFIAPPLTAERAALRFQDVLRASRTGAPEQQFLTLLTNGTQTAFGVCGVTRFHLDQRRAEIGIVLAPAARGRGLGQEALSGLVASAFARLPIDEVWVQYAPANKAFKHLANTLGFARCGLRTSPAAHASRLTESIDRHTWNARPTDYQRGASHVESSEYPGSPGARCRVAACE